jgi:uncharacterized repeat protein (TIGR03803 family)
MTTISEEMPKAVIARSNSRRFIPWVGTVTAIATAALFASANIADAQPTEAVVHSFSGTNGIMPQAGLIEANDGSGTLYGTTSTGGDPGCGDIFGCGTIFSVAPDGTGFTVLHTFYGPTDGAFPVAALLQTADGMLYGTTPSGGTTGGHFGAGTVFQVAPDGSGFNVLYTFKGGADGGAPLAGLIQGSDGMLYGTTAAGGGFQTCAASGCGTIFTIATDGSAYAILHSFTGVATDGGGPAGGLIQTSDGTLYGTTAGSGAHGNGTIFQIATDGSGFTLLHSFAPGLGDGANARAGLFQGIDGFLYGTTAGGGVEGGTVFSIAPDGSSYAVLYALSGFGGGGAAPYGGVIQGTDGFLYGTASVGGGFRCNCGTVFQAATDGSGYLDIYRFQGTDGGVPVANVIQASDGNFYGTSKYGGTSNTGIVFQLTFSSPAPAGR